MNERLYLLKIRLLDIEPEIRRRFLCRKDSTHEEYERFVEWSGGDFDSEKFDSDIVNWELMKYLCWSRNRFKDWGGIK